MDASKPFVVACIPAKNEEGTIGRVVLQAKMCVDKVIVCDDGSMDLTGRIAEELGAVVVKHERNRGKGAALKTAFRRAITFEPHVLVMLDADGQHDPSEIPKLIEPVLSGEADMVVGSRFMDGSIMDAPLYRRFGLKLINMLSSKNNENSVEDTQSGFRAFSLKAVNVMLEAEAVGYGVESEQLNLAEKNGLIMKEVPVSVRYRGLENTSKSHPLSHGAELLGIILRLIVEERPLLLLGLPGFLFILVGMFAGVYFLWFFNRTRYFSLPMALITLGAIVMGALLIITSLLLYAITRLKLTQNNV